MHVLKHGLRREASEVVTLTELVISSVGCVSLPIAEAILTDYALLVSCCVPLVNVNT